MAENNENKVEAVLTKLDEIHGSREQTYNVMLDLFLRLTLLGVPDDYEGEFNNLDDLCALWLRSRQSKQDQMPLSLF